MKHHTAKHKCGCILSSSLFATGTGKLLWQVQAKYWPTTVCWCASAVTGHHPLNFNNFSSEDVSFVTLIPSVGDGGLQPIRVVVFRGREVNPAIHTLRKGTRGSGSTVVDDDDHDDGDGAWRALSIGVFIAQSRAVRRASLGWDFFVSFQFPLFFLGVLFPGLKAFHCRRCHVFERVIQPFHLCCSCGGNRKARWCSRSFFLNPGISII